MRCKCKNLINGHHIACQYPALGKFWEFFEQEGYAPTPHDYSHYGKLLPNGNTMNVWVTKTAVMPRGHIEVRKWEESKNESNKWFAKSYGGVVFDPADPDHFEKFKHHVLHASDVKFINRKEAWDGTWSATDETNPLY